MKRSILAAALAAIMLLSGCSGVSQEEYNSLLEENSRLESENTSLQNKSSGSENTNNWESSTSSTENSNNQDDEYRMPKDHVKRVAKVLSLNFGTANTKNTNLGISQYNLVADCVLAGYNNQLKVIFNLTTNNTLQEKAAFCHYFLGLDMADRVEENIEKGIENAVIVANDINGSPFAVWLAYNNNGTIVHDMDIVDMAVLNSIDEVIRDSDKWKYIPVEEENTSTPEMSAPQSSSSVSTENPIESQTPPNQDTTTTGERNALKKAQSYLNSIPFSRDGLIEQLEYNGFSNAEATYGADNVGADWSDQALKKAKSYIDTMPFSYTGLIEQLEYNKFTHEQAVYGADNCGADWNEQAAKKAKSYLDIMAFSRDGLIEQLEYNGFTHDQAVYGVTQNGY